MTAIDIHVTPGFDVLQALSGTLGTPLKDQHLQLPAALGEGNVSGWSFPGDIRLYRFAFMLKTPLTISTTNPLETGLYTIFINLSGNAPVSKVEGLDTGTTLPGNGIVFLHPSKSITYCPASEWFDFMLISFTGKTISLYFNSDTSAPIYARKGDYLFIETTPDLNRHLNDIMDGIAQNMQGSSLYLHGAVLHFINAILKITEKRNPSGHAGIHQDDLLRLLSIRNLLKARLQDPPTIPELARYSGISESKLKQLFKIFFGNTIYQYIQYLRMLEAQKLFLTGAYNISQVAAKVGYSNLTHFSDAFEKHCGSRPAAFKK